MTLNFIPGLLEGKTETEKYLILAAIRGHAARHTHRTRRQHLQMRDPIKRESSSEQQSTTRSRDNIGVHESLASLEHNMQIERRWSSINNRTVTVEHGSFQRYLHALKEPRLTRNVSFRLPLPFRVCQCPLVHKAKISTDDSQIGKWSDRACKQYMKSSTLSLSSTKKDSVCFMTTDSSVQAHRQ